MANGRRSGNKPWKGIYGVDRKYTRRMDRLRDREAMKAEIAEHAATPSEMFVRIDEIRTYIDDKNWTFTSGGTL